MSNHSPLPVRLVLCDNEGIGRVTVDIEPFFEFSFWMAEELQDLVFQHRDFARVARTGDRISPRLRQ